MKGGDPSRQYKAPWHHCINTLFLKSNKQHFYLMFDQKSKIKNQKSISIALEIKNKPSTNDVVVSNATFTTFA